MNRGAKLVTAKALFLVGALVTMALAAGIAWASFEGLSYFSTGAGYGPYGGLHCPILISRSEAGVVRADFENPTDQVQQPYYEVEISGRVASRTLEGQIVVPPHATRSAIWTVNADDIDIEPFIFVKMDVLPIGSSATREATCGILVADVIGLAGAQALSIAVAMGLLCLLAGSLIPGFEANGTGAARPGTVPSVNSGRLSQALGVATAASLLAALMGWWPIAFLLLAVSLLLLAMLVSSVIAGG